MALISETTTGEVDKRASFSLEHVPAPGLLIGVNREGDRYDALINRAGGKGSNVDSSDGDRLG